MAPPARKTTSSGGVSNDVLSEQVRGVSSRIDGIDTTLRAVAESLTAFVRLEERHAALIKQVEAMVSMVQDNKELEDERHEKIAERMATVETNMPPLMEIRRWIIGGILGIVALVLIGVYNGYLNSRQDIRATTPAAVNSVPSELARVPAPPHSDQ